MLFGVIGFAIGCFVGGGLVFVCFALVAAGAGEEDAHIFERYEDGLK